MHLREEHEKVLIRRNTKKRKQLDDGLSELIKEQDGGGDAPKSKMMEAARRWVEGTKERICEGSNQRLSRTES